VAMWMSAVTRTAATSGVPADRTRVSTADQR
jgi:hypothetical protein